MPDIYHYHTRRVLYSRVQGGAAADITSYIPESQGSVTISRTMGQPMATASIQLRKLPFVPYHKDWVEIWLGYDGVNYRRFSGFVTNPGGQAFPTGNVLQCTDALWPASFPIEEAASRVLFDRDGNPVAVQTASIVLNGPGGTPNDVSATDAIVRLLRDFGSIPDVRLAIPTLYRSVGVPWVLGHLTPVTWTNVAPLSAAQQIADVLGYWLFADASGVVRMQQVSGIPSSVALGTFAEGVNILIPGMSYDAQTDSFYNEVKVTGGNTLLVPGAAGGGPSGAFPVYYVRHADWPALLPTGKTRQLQYSNPLIEAQSAADGGDASCESVSARLLLEHSRIPFVVQGGVCDGDASRWVGQTWNLIAPRLRVADGRHMVITQLNEASGGGVWRHQLVLDGGVGSAGYLTDAGTNPPPRPPTNTSSSPTWGGNTDPYYPPSGALGDFPGMQSCFPYTSTPLGPGFGVSNDLPNPTAAYAPANTATAPMPAFSAYFMEETDAAGHHEWDMACHADLVSPTGAPIASYAWACAQANPSTGIGRAWVTVIPASAGSVTVTLTVTDTNGVTSAAYTRTFTPGVNTPLMSASMTLT